jgi:hypothetical protein
VAALAKKAAENQVANKLVADMVAANPEMINSIVSENQRVLVIYAL